MSSSQSQQPLTESVSFVLTCTDMRRFHQYAVCHVPRVRRAQVVTVNLIAVLAALAFWIIVYREGFRYCPAVPLMTSLMFISVSAMVWGLLYLLQGVVMYRQAIALYGKEAMNRTVRLLPESLEQQSGGMLTQFLWVNVKGVYKTPTQILIFVSERAAVIVPDRAFETDEARQVFYDRIKALYGQHHSLSGK